MRFRESYRVKFHQSERAMIGRYVGTIAAFIETKHIGFLFCEELDRRVFFHEAAWHRAVPPVIGEQVTFDLKPSGIAGLPDKAADVRPIVNSIGIGALAGGAR